MMTIQGRGKQGYLDGMISEPTKTDPLYTTWFANNNIVMSWLVNSMNDDIQNNYLCYPTAKKIWDSLNSAQFFELRNMA